MGEKFGNNEKKKKNDGKPSRKCLGSVMEAPRLKCIAKGVRDLWNSLPSSLRNPASKIFWKA